MSVTLFSIHFQLHYFVFCRQNEKSASHVVVRFNKPFEHLGTLPSDFLLYRRRGQYQRLTTNLLFVSVFFTRRYFKNKTPVHKLTLNNIETVLREAIT